MLFLVSVFPFLIVLLMVVLSLFVLYWSLPCEWINQQLPHGLHDGIDTLLDVVGDPPDSSTINIILMLPSSGFVCWLLMKKKNISYQKQLPAVEMSTTHINFHLMSTIHLYLMSNMYIFI